jgi:hypothetical protein
LEHERVGPALDHGDKGPLEVLRPPRLDALELHTQRPGLPLDVVWHRLVEGIHRIDQDGHAGNRGDRFLQQREAFPQVLDELGVQPGEVPTGPLQALDHT